MAAPSPNPDHSLPVADRPSMRLLRCAVAGLLAGTVATVFELLAWWLVGMPLPDTLFRDTRLAAAIALGTDVIAAPQLATTPSLAVWCVAGFIHCALSVLYALLYAAVLAFVQGRLFAAASAPAKRRLNLLAGAGFGLVLYLVNMYGFTALYPWFAAVRDSVTLLAHLIFGASLAAVLQRLRQWS